MSMINNYLLSVWILSIAAALTIEDEYFSYSLTSSELDLDFLKPNKPPAEILGDESNGCYCRGYPADIVVCFGRNSCEHTPQISNIQTPRFSICNSRISSFSSSDFKILQNITDLRIEGNNLLTQILPDTFIHNRKLQNLSISFNLQLSILHIDTFRGLTNLQSLYLIKNGFNRILDMTTALSPNILPNLVKLYLNQNKFRNVTSNDFMPMSGSGLKQLDLVLCRIDSMEPDTFSALVNLQVLRLGENNFNISTITSVIDSIIVYNLPLKLLDLSAAGFRTELPKQLLEVISRSNISTLILARNHFQSISHDTFPHMPNVTGLDLSGVLALEISDDAFINLPNLTKLNLARNRLYRIRKDLKLPNLQYLDLQDNTESDYNSSYFNIPYERFAELSELRYLNLNNNPIVHLCNKSFEGLDKLETLSLRNTSLYNISNGTFVPVENLRSLNLENNRFVRNEYSKTIPCYLFDGLYKLEALYLGDCELSVFSLECNPFADLKSLKHLGLERNRILSIPAFVLESLTNLRSINMAFNLVTVWQERKFANNRRLHTIVMSYNRINYLSHAMLDDFYNATYLDLLYNPINCQCEFSATLNDWLKQRQIINQTKLDGLYERTICLTEINSTVVQYLRKVNNGTVHCDDSGFYFSTSVSVSLALLLLCFIFLIYFIYYFRLRRCSNYNVSPSMKPVVGSF